MACWLPRSRWVERAGTKPLSFGVADILVYSSLWTSHERKIVRGFGVPEVSDILFYLIPSVPDLQCMLLPSTPFLPVPSILLHLVLPSALSDSFFVFRTKHCSGEGVWLHWFSSIVLIAFCCVPGFLWLDRYNLFISPLCLRSALSRLLVPQYCPRRVAFPPIQ